MATIRQNPSYSDGTPGASDRIIFETSGNTPQGCAPATLKAALAVAVADVTGLQTALDAKAPLANPTFTGTMSLGGSLDANGNSIIDYLQPHVASVTGTLTQAAHGGRAILITGNVAAPVANGFICLVRNKSGVSRTITPVSGNLIHDGATAASIVLPTNRSVTVHGDGTDVWVDGAIA